MTILDCQVLSLMRLFVSGTRHTPTLQVSLTIEGLQVDNQLENGGFAVVVRPRSIPSKRREDGHLLILPGKNDSF